MRLFHVVSLRSTTCYCLTTRAASLFIKSAAPIGAAGMGESELSEDSEDSESSDNLENSEGLFFAGGFGACGFADGSEHVEFGVFVVAEVEEFGIGGDALLEVGEVFL